MAQCFEALKTYGKEPEQMVAVANMFQMVLSDYPISKIKSAFKTYLKTNSELPAPADIVHLIERGNKPPWIERFTFRSASATRTEHFLAIYVRMAVHARV